eukprot:1149258-Pelagomonas_calceolata.AAC.3
MVLSSIYQPEQNLLTSKQAFTHFATLKDTSFFINPHPFQQGQIGPYAAHRASRPSLTPRIYHLSIFAHEGQACLSVAIWKSPMERGGQLESVATVCAFAQPSASQDRRKRSELIIPAMNCPSQN